MHSSTPDCYESCRIKAEIVAPMSASPAAGVLFRHTFGHAIETAQGYGAWLHGEAVAAGMCDRGAIVGTHMRAAYERRGTIAKSTRLAGLPTDPPRLAPDRWVELRAATRRSPTAPFAFVLLESLRARGTHRRRRAEHLAATLAA